MSALQPRYSREEFARRGQEIYERDVRPRVDPSDEGKFAAIDIETGRYELDGDDYTATERLLRDNPEAQIWLVRVGYRTTYHIGSVEVLGDVARLSRFVSRTIVGRVRVTLGVRRGPVPP